MYQLNITRRKNNMTKLKALHFSDDNFIVVYGMSCLLCGRKPFGKRRKCRLPLFSPFSNNIFIWVFSSTGRRPASYCHGVVSVRASIHPSVRACVRKLFLQKTSPQKLLIGFLRNFTGMFLRWTSFKFLQIIVFYEEFWLPWRSK